MNNRSIIIILQNKIIYLYIDFSIRTKFEAPQRINIIRNYLIMNLYHIKYLVNWSSWNVL